MADDESKDEQNLEAEAEEEEEEKRRLLLPIWPLLLAALLLAAGYLGYQAVTQGPVLVEIIQSRNCLTCHAELEPLFKKKTTHWPFNQGRCVACHTPHGYEKLESQSLITRLLGGAKKETVKGAVSPHQRLPRFKAPVPNQVSKLRAAPNKLCVNKCHARQVAVEENKKYKMPPFAKKQCLSCHQAHPSDTEFLLNAPVKTVCLSCHPKITVFYKASNLHPPFKVGSCNSCHRGHASNVKKLLRRRPPLLCFGCHPSVAKLSKLPVKMEPFEKGECPKCHNPHGSNNRKLLQAEVPALCFNCHKKIAALRKKPVQMPPFRLGLCLSCHRPHASENAKLLQASLEKNEICYLCHEDVKANYLSIGHNRVVSFFSRYQPEGGIGSCLNCHEPHGSDYSGLIQDEQISLCLSCHGPRRYFAHPVGLKWEDPWHGNYLRCASCHNPMGSGIVRLKRKDLDGLCLSCHLASDPSYIYRQNQPWHKYRVPDSFP